MNRKRRTPTYESGGKNEPTGFARGTFSVAVIVLIAYGLFTWWLIREVGSDQDHWDRLIYLYQGVEAVVFAAAGAIFGSVVQRHRVQQAEDGEAKAKKDAESSGTDAAVGAAMESAVRALLPGTSTDPGDGTTPEWTDRRIGSAAPPVVAPGSESEDMGAFLLRLAREVRQRRS